MWLFCFSPIFSTGESCEQSLLPVVLMRQEKGARSPGYTAECLHGMACSRSGSSSSTPCLSRRCGCKSCVWPHFRQAPLPISICDAPSVLPSEPHHPHPCSCSAPQLLSVPARNPLPSPSFSPPPPHHPAGTPQATVLLTFPTLTPQTPSRFTSSSLPLSQPAWLHGHLSISMKFSKPRAFWKG